MTANTDTYTFITPVTSDHLGNVVTLFDQAWWSKGRPRPNVARMLATPPLSAGMTLGDGAPLIAYCRAITDDVFAACILDVIVHQDHRHRGVGTRLIRKFLTLDDVRKVEFVELYCADHLVNFYGQFGFTPTGTNHLRRQQH